MPARGRRRESGRQATRFLVLLVSILLLGNALIGERGLVTIVRVRQELTALDRMITALRVENTGLRQQVRALREEPRVIEELARRELGLMSPGEKLFIVTPAPRTDWVTVPAEFSTSAVPTPAGSASRP